MSQPFSNPYIYRACYLHDSIPENARDATRKVGYKNRVFKRFDVRRGNVRSSRVDIILFGEKHACHHHVTIHRVRVYRYDSCP